MKIDNVIKIETKFSEIYVYRYVNGVKKVEHHELENYFYINLEDKNKIDVFLKSIGLEYIIKDKVYNSIYNKKVLKIIPNKFHYYKCGKAIKAQGFETHEYSIEPYLKFLLENEISWTSNYRKAIIDIETDMCLSISKVDKPITSICIYDYLTNKYTIWSWNENKVILEDLDADVKLFKNEIDMLLSFINDFRELDIDVLMGWNTENYDVPYIINRIKRQLGNADLLSKYSNIVPVECRIKRYKTKEIIENIVPGMDVVDMIPVMKKANCYKAQPASFSLKSTANFYLEDEHKMNFDLTNRLTDFNNFLKYNKQDVYITKQLIDKYELFSFMDILHSEISQGLPFRLITYNSLILLYALKQKYKDIAFPEKGGNIKVDDNFLNKEDTLKIKAAIVLHPVPGIHENVILFDFKSLYPTIMRTFNISPDTISENDGILIDDITMDINGKEKKASRRFKQDIVGIYPMLVKELMERRGYYKGLAKEAAKTHGKKSFEYMKFAFRDDVAKQNLNSLYGVGAARTFQLFNPYIAGAITAMSRKLITFVSNYVKEKGYIPIFGDTDSCGIKVPKEISPTELTAELNEAIKKYVLTNWPETKEHYCLDFEFEKVFDKFLIKEAKKRYFGIEDNGEIYCKGFQIVRHDYGKKVQEILTDIFKDLLLIKNPIDIRKKLHSEYKSKFYSLSPKEIGIELKISKDVEEYTTKVQQIEAAKYSNKYLNTDFKGGDVGKLIYIKDSLNQLKYPKTEYVLLDEEIDVPSSLIVDYDRMWEKLILNSLQTLEELKELQIILILSNNKTLFEF